MPNKTKTIDLNNYLIWDFEQYWTYDQLKELSQKDLKDLYFHYDTLIDCFYEKPLELRTDPEEIFGLGLIIQITRNARILLNSEPTGLLKSEFLSNILEIEIK